MSRDGSILAFRGTLAGLDSGARAALIERGADRDPELAAGVSATIDRVRARGDAALRVILAEFHGAAPRELEVPRPRLRAALDSLDPRLRAALERAAANLARAHRGEIPGPSETETEPGVIVGRRPDPLDRVGCYAPGGRAAYPSSVLMAAVPARVAGVGEVIVCSPPGPDGLPPPVVMAAAEVAGADRVFAAGGAAAIAAMAFGTETIPRVQRIVGPGNAYVTEAKLQVAGIVSIDSPAGPSELLVVADASADPAAVALEMIAQAEHDPRASAVAVAIGSESARRIEEALARLLSSIGRREIVAASLSTRGAVLAAESLEQALAFAADYAPEHLLLSVAEPEAWLPRARNAGTVFLGSSSSNAFGDYLTGANHTLPTGGLARSYSGLSTLDFVRWTTYQRVTPEAATRLADDAAAIAEAEGLPGHAAAARRAGAGDPPRHRADAAPPATLQLDDNTNIYGPPPAAIEALGLIAPETVSRYPSARAGALERALAEYAGVRPEEIVTGCGSDDVLDSALKVLGAPGMRFAYCVPTFSLIPILAAIHRLDKVEAPFAPGGDVDAAGLLATGAPLVYLCSPNNPTGAAASEEALERVIEGARGHVILDQAYAEFASGTGEAGSRWTSAAPRHGRLLVVRTLSKAFGLAGLRIGYGVAEAGLVAELGRARGPYKVNALAERAAVAALERSREWVRERAAEVATLRDRFARALAAIGAAPLPSAANFVLVPVPDAAAAAAALRRAGVAVRSFEALPGIGDAIRVTVGQWPAMERAIEAMRETRLFAAEAAR